MSDRLEWADTTSGAELLFPGEDIDGAIVENGQVAIAFWTGSNGIALSGPPQDLASRLEQAAAIARTVAKFLAEPLRHLPDGLDPRARIAPGVGADTPEEDASTTCGTPGITVADPRRVTCGDCVAAWNTCWPEFAIPVVLSISADPDDHTIADRPPYAFITWINEAPDDGDEELPGGLSAPNGSATPEVWTSSASDS